MVVFVTVANLPPPDMKRWVIRRKAEFVAAVRGDFEPGRGLRTLYFDSRRIPVVATIDGSAWAAWAPSHTAARLPRVKKIGEALPLYDAVVIGSGYGGGVAASRLARMGLHLAVLEQGRLMRPGDFPTTGKARLKALRLTGFAPKLGDPAGLYYLSVGKGLTVFGASGLGGGSLINAGVVLRPDFARLRKAGWPDAVLSEWAPAEGARSGGGHAWCRASA